MESIRTVDNKIVPLKSADGTSAWAYNSFFVVDILHPKETCRRCDRTITYVYVASHPQHGVTRLGSECIHEVLSDEALKSAMAEFHQASSKINQSRFRNRIKNIRNLIPKGILEILRIQTHRGPVLAKEVLDHLENKLQLRVFLSSYELDILRRLEAKV